MSAIQLYTWPTPNGFKVSILLEELGLPYDVHAIDIGAGDQFGAEFLAISPDMVQWLMFQMGGVGPMLGQAHHFRQYAPEPVPYAVDRYTKEAGRLYGVMDRRLADHAYLAGDDYSLADIATFPWTRSIERQGHALADFPNVDRWFKAIDARPAVQAGLRVLADRRKEGPMDDKAKAVLFGEAQYAQR